MQELQTDIYQIQAPLPGKSITLIGGTHGNERTGVEVVTRMKAMIESGELVIIQGSLTLIYGNPRAIELNERGSEPHADLNRAFVTDLLECDPTGTYEDARAREIAPFLQSSDVVIDLHATNKPSEPFLASKDSERHQQVYRWFPSKKVLSDPQYVLAGFPATVDDYTDVYGGVGVCYETGQASDLGRVEEVLQNVINCLKDQGLVEGHVEAPDATRDIFELTEAIILTDEGFTFAEGFGEGSWEAFAQGEVLGAHGDTAFVAEYDGVIVFPKMPEHRKVGKPVGYLAKRN